jgi:hypothetical protein
MTGARRGISILELMVVLSASTVVLSLSSVLLQRVMRIHIQSRADLGAERTALRLSEQFRRDVHQARAAITDRAELGDNIVLRLTFADDQPVEYSYNSGILERVKSKGGNRLAREEFVFPANSDLTIESPGAPQRLILTVTTPRSADGDKQHLPARKLTIPLSVQVEAVVGSDWRFAGTLSPAEAQQ